MKNRKQVEQFLKTELKRNYDEEIKDTLRNIQSYMHGVSIKELYHDLRPEKEITETDKEIVRAVKDFIGN